MKKFLLTFLKIGISVAIIAWLVVAAKNDNAFTDLSQQYHDPGFAWGLLAAACVSCGAAVVITLVRWYYLVRALGIGLSLKEAFRLGFLGYLFNLAPMGIVGGDLLKAVMLARQQRNRRAQAFATVIVDRAIGLYMLFVVASIAILLTGFFMHATAEVRSISWATLITTAVSSLGLGALFMPSVARGKAISYLERLRYVGRPLGHLVDALRLYRRNVPVLAASCLMTVGVHGLFALGIYFITLGIYQGHVQDLTLPAEFIVSPLSAAAGVIPLALGPMEVVLDFLYANIFGLDKRQGFVVALGYRLVTLLIAMVGVCYYLGARREVAEVMHEAEEEQELDSELSDETVACRP